MAESHPARRKTRFVVVADTHNGTPGGSFKLPKGDVLIHAGDLTNQGHYKELHKAVTWIEAADFEVKIVIAGNHDITLDTGFYSQYGLNFHNQDPQDYQSCQDLLNSSEAILYLRNESANVRLVNSDGPRTMFKVFGSPLSPAKGMWAFGYSAEEAPRIWDNIPLDADVVITHTPPKYHLDERSDRRAAGCEALRCALWRVRPQLAICGHIHESRGAEIVKWDLTASNIKYKEAGVDRWTDPGKDSKKQSLVDLTSRSKRPLINNGSATHGSLPILSRELLTGPAEAPYQNAYGQGGTPPSCRCDLEALQGRMGRQETCVVNAAMMASSWPHRGVGGKRFNKPIVVDLDLPSWEDCDELLNSQVT